MPIQEIDKLLIMVHLGQYNMSLPQHWYREDRAIFRLKEPLIRSFGEMPEDALLIYYHPSKEEDWLETLERYQNGDSTLHKVQRANTELTLAAEEILGERCITIFNDHPPFWEFRYRGIKKARELMAERDFIFPTDLSRLTITVLGEALQLCVSDTAKAWRRALGESPQIYIPAEYTDCYRLTGKEKEVRGLREMGIELILASSHRECNAMLMGETRI